MCTYFGWCTFYLQIFSGQGVNVINIMQINKFKIKTDYKGDIMYCKKCGMLITNENHKFCQNCGEPIGQCKTLVKH